MPYYTYTATITIQVTDKDGINGSITRKIKREEFSSAEGIASPDLIAQILTSITEEDIFPGRNKAQTELDAFAGGAP